MKAKPVGSWRKATAHAVLIVCGLAIAGASAQADMPKPMDPKLVVGNKKCGECHKGERKVLTGTQHYKTYKAMHKSDEAKKILAELKANNVKVRSAKRGVCVDCHYTQQAKGSRRAKVISGITCESCHGAGANWLEIHNDYGKSADGKEAKRKGETKEHRAARLKKSASMGMIRPDQPYDLARNCFQCHTVLNEEIVNLGGHKPGSDFELVSWFQKEIRHNFGLSNGKKNRAAARDYDPKSRRRLLYAVGRAVDLEYSLRAIALAKKKGAYLNQMLVRAKDNICKVQDIVKAAKIPEMKKILAAAKRAKLALGGGAGLNKAADAIQALARGMGRKNDGSKWKGLDALVAKGQYANTACR